MMGPDEIKMRIGAAIAAAANAGTGPRAEATDVALVLVEAARFILATAFDRSGMADPGDRADAHIVRFVSGATRLRGIALHGAIDVATTAIEASHAVG